MMMMTQPQHPASRNSASFLGVGIMQITLGILCGATTGAGMMGKFSGINKYIFCGFWAIFWYILSGALAISTAACANSCNVCLGMAISILACINALGIACYEASIAYFAKWACGFLGCQISNFLLIHAILAALSFIEFIVAIIHSALCCQGCHGPQNTVAVVGGTTSITTTALSTQAPAQNYITTVRV